MGGEACLSVRVADWEAVVADCFPDASCRSIRQGSFFPPSDCR